MNAHISEREAFIEFISHELIGPAEGVDEVIQERPDKKYLAGILFPQETDAGDFTDDEEQGEIAESDNNEIESPVDLLFQRLPASVGLSFYVTECKALRVDIEGGCYTRESVSGDGLGRHSTASVRVWKRQGLEEKDVRIPVGPPGKGTSKNLFSGKVGLHSIWRPFGGGHIVTVSLVNTTRNSDKGSDPADCIFQVRFRCSPESGLIASYPGERGLSADEEDEELSLQYRNNQTFAIGHGCAAGWEHSLTTDRGSPPWVETCFLPRAEIKPVTTVLEERSFPEEILSLQYLQDSSKPKEDILKGLEKFVNDYDSWFQDIGQENLPDELEAAAQRILQRIAGTIGRMREGIAILREENAAYEIFQLSNRAMLIQMIHAGEEYAGTPRLANAGKFMRPDYDDQQRFSIAFRWHPFQLGFFLLSLKGLWEPESDDRKLVDLIWFPTGGGKTEAYFLVASFEILRRRILEGARGSGTSVIKRYTLRLLTTQQFQRSAGLICALEYLRRADPERLGEDEISIGLWIGEDTPYSFVDAQKQYLDLVNAVDITNPFPLQVCPACGTEIVPTGTFEGDEGLGIHSTETSFRFFCPSSSCDFNDRLPVQVVDEVLYRDPPTLLIGTIDKFARLAWDARSRNFFGGEEHLPPTLVIQDELHLISGTLGTVAGVYEAAIDAAIRFQKYGRIPKILAATATIRRAGEQVERLYGRPVSIFPPPGIDSDDSFFARVNHNAVGRTSIGAMGQGHTPIFSTVMCASVLVQAIETLSLSQEATEQWSTLVAYHNSRRELGKTMTLMRDDVPSRLRAVAAGRSNLRKLKEVEELSSNSPPKKELGALIERLKTPYGGRGAIDVLACTSMLSVGVDVGRLGLMMVLGQPKTTSEYIQSTSRVGRREDRPPGIVLTLYSSTKPRDRSHYEMFLSYHNAIYRHVEPTSVTPYALPSRMRALHAAVIVAVRMATKFHENTDASEFSPDQTKIRELLEFLKQRMADADATEAAETADQIDDIVKEWIAAVSQARNELKGLRYSGVDRAYMSLIRQFGGTGSGWNTLNSMRHVDTECSVVVAGERFQ